MADNPPQHDYTIDTPSIYSNDADDEENFAEWPRLIGLEDQELDLSFAQKDGWYTRPCPAELHHFPEDCPEELARIIKDSVVPDLYRPSSTDGEDQLEASQEYSTALTLHNAPNGSAPSNALHHSPSSSDQSLASSERSSATASSKTSVQLSLKAPSSVRELKPRTQELNSFRECAGCFSEIQGQNIPTLTCQHKFCLKCLRDLVNQAINNDATFPPQCCHQEIPKEVVFDNLDYSTRKAYKEKRDEHSLPQHERWYCPLPTCHQWIPPKSIKSGSPTQKCPSCRLPICSLCRGIAHNVPEDCPKQFDLETAQVEDNCPNTERCPKCGILVEMSRDSQHVSCSCGAMFCGICGAKRNTCGCTENDPQRRKRELWIQKVGRDQQAEREASEIAVAMEEMKMMQQREFQDRCHVEEEHKRTQREVQRREEQQASLKDRKRMEAVEDAMRSLRDELYRINKLQQHRIAERHRVCAQKLHAKILCDQTEWEQRRKTLRGALKANLQQRIDALDESQASEAKALASRQEEEEDDAFLSMTRHLKGKNNREERERGIMEKLKAAQEQEQVSIRKAHEDAREELEFRGNLEKCALESGMALDIDEIRKEGNADTRELGQGVVADRKWFDAVVEKRSDLLERYNAELASGNKELPTLVQQPQSPDSPHPHHPPTTWHIEDKLAALPRIDTNLSNIRPLRLEPQVPALVYG